MGTTRPRPRPLGQVTMAAKNMHITKIEVAKGQEKAICLGMMGQAKAWRRGQGMRATAKAMGTTRPRTRPLGQVKAMAAKNMHITKIEVAKGQEKAIALA
jgi:hypothetical protein